MSGIGKKVTFKDKGDRSRKVKGTVEDEVFVMVNDYRQMIQRIKFEDGASWDSSTHAYRAGYYTYDAKKKRIFWGQYTQVVTQNEYKELLNKAQKKGWDIF